MGNNRAGLLNKATVYCEKYGIVEFRIEGYYLIYNKSYPAYLNNSRYTVQHRVDLRTMQETTKRLKRFDRKGYLNC